MDSLRKNNGSTPSLKIESKADLSMAGFTLIEILIASLLSSVVFLAIASSYSSGLRLMSASPATTLDPAIALNLMSKNIALANQITVDTFGWGSYCMTLTLNLDYTLDANGVPVAPNYTQNPNDDSTILYFINVGLKRLFTQYRNAGSRMSSAKEVMPGMALTGGGFSLYNPVNDESNAVMIRLRSGGKTFQTTVPAEATSKRLT